MEFESRPVYIYGSGTFAERVFKVLDQLGITVTGYIDHLANTGVRANHLPFFQASEVKLPNDSIVILGVCNLFGDLKKIANQLLVRSQNIQIISPVEFAQYLDGLGISFSNYWLSGDVSIYERHQSEIMEFSNLLSDSRSIEILNQTIKYRVTGKLEDLSAPDPIETQYLPSGLHTPPKRLTVLELGSFQGEDLVRLVGQGHELLCGFALEPDLMNYKNLLLNLRNNHISNIYPLPLGAWSSTRLLRFVTGESGAHLDPVGEQIVSVVRPDDLVNQLPINYIKMDIEGAEVEALEGCLEIIRKNSPHLAISVYHKPEHLWDLGLKIERMFPRKYFYYLRTYGYQTFDTILYCIPR